MNCCAENNSGNATINENRVLLPILVQRKIPRPPNAFMLYANENRKTMAHLYPADSNKEISRRLGRSWKDLKLQEKNKYFQKARAVDVEHKRKYPGYVYNPKDARIRKAMRDNFRDRSIGASPLLPRPSFRQASSPVLYNNLIMSNPLAQIQRQNPMWNGYPEMYNKSGNVLVCAQNDLDKSPYCFDEMRNLDGNITISSLTVGGKNNLVFNGDVITDTGDPLTESNAEEEQILFDREKEQIAAAESYVKVFKPEMIPENAYLPLSSTKFIANPELFTNNADYHKEYIVKYFNSVPDYETFNVTTEDGLSFPYVTIPNLIISRAKY